MSDQKKPTDTSPEEGRANELDEDQLEDVAGGLGSADGAGAGLPTESITFNYSKVEYKYIPGNGGNETGEPPAAYPLPKKK